MAGVKGRSGRKKKTVNTHNAKVVLDELQPYALENIRRSVQQKIDVTCPQCSYEFQIDGGGDVDDSRWVYEQKHGKAKQQVGIDMEYQSRGEAFMEEMRTKLLGEIERLTEINRRLVALCVEGGISIPTDLLEGASIAGYLTQGNKEGTGNDG